MRKKVFISILSCLLISFFSTLSLANKVETLKLVEGDCIKCHPKQIKEINERGAAHKKMVECIDCHPEHPPLGKNSIAACSACHQLEDSPHFAVKECKICHYPHYPTEMDYSKAASVKSACISCHPDQGKELKANPSKHTKLDCKKCHEEHGQSTACMGCHEPHAAGMSHEDCMRCHKPHNAKAGKYYTAVSSVLCVGCHKEVVQTLSKKGGAHSKVNCTDCHKQHPPSEKDVIPKCSLCHLKSAKPHYKEENCASCHHAHYPMDMNLGKVDSVRSACLSCHSKQGKELTTHPSKHTELDCKECHLEHKQSTECMECHEPHTAGMIFKDCIECHKPHMPIKILYGKDIKSPVCIGCHESVGKKLASKQTKHQKLECVYCHKNEHKRTLQCRTCHGEPHKFQIHTKFPDCITCHQDPHALVK